MIFVHDKAILLSYVLPNSNIIYTFEYEFVDFPIFLSFLEFYIFPPHWFPLHPLATSHPSITSCSRLSLVIIFPHFCETLAGKSFPQNFGRVCEHNFVSENSCFRRIFRGIRELAFGSILAPRHFFGCSLFVTIVFTLVMHFLLLLGIVSNVYEDKQFDALRFWRGREFFFVGLSFLTFLLSTTFLPLLYSQSIRRCQTW